MNKLLLYDLHSIYKDSIVDSEAQEKGRLYLANNGILTVHCFVCILSIEVTISYCLNRSGRDVLPRSGSIRTNSVIHVFSDTSQISPGFMSLQCCRGHP